MSLPLTTTHEKGIFGGVSGRFRESTMGVVAASDAGAGGSETEPGVR
jgi:hypothetical protein